MKQKKENRVALLLHWAGEQKIWLFLAIFLSAVSGLCIIVPYIGIYRLMDATFNHTCTQELVVHTVVMIAVAVTLRFALFGCSGVAAHKGAYGALFKVRCMVAEHMARAPLGALNERRTGDIKTVLNEDIEKLELFLAHNLPDLVCYLVGPVVIFIYLMTVNIPLALISLVPLILAVVVMGMMFRNTDDLMERANHSITTLNSVMIEYISGMKLIKAYNMGSKSFQKFSDAIQEENAMWNETSRRMGPPYAAFVVIIECGMLMMVPIGGMFFLKGSLAASAFLLFVYVGSMYLTEIRPLQELGTNFANVLNAVTKTKEILDIPIYEGGTDFPQKHDIELQNVRFSYDGKTDVLHGVNLKINDGERMALVGRSGAGKSTVIELISRFYDVQEGEVLTLQELLYGLMLSSGNDAAVALAIYCGGTVEGFVARMNDKARTLGLKDTHFANPNGLDAPDHYSSAADLAALGAYAMENPIFAKTVSTKTVQAGGRALRNHNKLLWQYEGCTGMKTGYTRQAGRTLVSSAERNGQTLVCVTLNDRDDWNDHKALLDYGFSAFPRQVLAEEGEELGRVPLQGSLLHMASVEARETVAYPLKQGEEVTMEVDLPDQAEAPVVQGEIAGSVRFLVGSRQVGQTYLVWSGSARRDVVKERPVDSPLDFLPQSTPPTYEEMLSLFSKAGTVSE